MQFRPIKHENTLYLIAFILAAALRFIQLGALPLNDTEAEWALQALNVAQGNRPLLGSQTIYILPTSSLFFLFRSSNFLARFIPALAGSLLAVVPYFFRERIKPFPALLLAFLLALDPGLVSLSRQAGSLILALTFVLLAWGFWWSARPRAAGVFAGLALLSGPSVWAGLLSLGLALLLRRLLEKPTVKTGAAENAESGGREKLREALTFGGATILLGGTMFLLSPNGLSAWLNALPEYLAGWVKPSGVSIGRMLFALMIYQPLAVLFGLMAVIRAWMQGRKRYMRLSLWLLTSIIVVLMYPARQVGDLAWVLIPLWALAALEISNHTRIFPEERREVSGLVLLVVILLIFSWINYAGIALNPADPINLARNVVRVGDTILFENLPPTRYILLIGVLLLLVVSVMMVALGWSSRTARLGSVWGVALALGLYSLGVSAGGTGLRTPGGWELWWPDRQPTQANLLLATINDQSEWSTGDTASQEVSLLDINSPALEWLLRDRKVTAVTALDTQEAPPIIISQAQVESPNLPIAYRGQDFSWRRAPSEGVLTMNTWIKWSVFRDMLYDTETVIVWVRNDLFVDSSESAVSSTKKQNIREMRVK